MRIFYFIYCISGCFIQASFIETVKNSPLRTLFFSKGEEKYSFISLPDDIYKEICDYLTFHEKKQFRITCKTVQKALDKACFFVPLLRDMSDFLAFDYYSNKQRHDSILMTTSSLSCSMMMHAKILCTLHLPPIASIGTDITFDIVLMKKDKYKKEYSVVEYQQLLQNKFSIYDALGVYVFRSYKKTGKESIKMYNYFADGFRLIVVLLNALYKQDDLSKKVKFFMLLRICLSWCKAEEEARCLSDWMRSCSSKNEYYDRAREEYKKICKKHVRKSHTYPSYFIPLFITTDVPTIDVKKNDDLDIEIRDTLSLDDAQKNKELCNMFYNPNAPWISKKLKETIRDLLFIIIVSSVASILLIEILYYLLIESNIFSQANSKRSLSKQAVIDYMQGYIRYVSQKAAVSA